MILLEVLHPILIRLGSATKAGDTAVGEAAAVEGCSSQRYLRIDRAKYYEVWHIARQMGGAIGSWGIYHIRIDDSWRASIRRLLISSQKTLPGSKSV
ncbi:hypothetical protein Tco_1576519 [Tanacetum coccineum]